MLLIEGKKVAAHRLESIRNNVTKAKEQIGKVPGLCVIRVGEDPASKVYVSKKIKTCQDLGIHSKEIHLPYNTTETEVLKEIESLNKDQDIHGILVQLPLPKEISVNKVIETVDPTKEVDGFHPFNLGRMLANQPTFYPCTPLGIMNLLEHYKLPIAGKRAVVMGRSRIVGRPLAIMLDQAGATVTTVHLKTENPKQITSQADLLVVATGQKHLVGPEHVKQGSIVIDVGIHRLETGKLTGDVDFESVKSKVSAITPVPGGVGPMTIASLIENTWKSFSRHQNLANAKH